MSAIVRDRAAVLVPWVIERRSDLVVAYRAQEAMGIVNKRHRRLFFGLDILAVPLQNSARYTSDRTRRTAG